MNDRKLIRKTILLGAAILISLLQVSCNRFEENLPECRLLVRFKYDYNMLSVDAFHTRVEKVDLYVFDQDGKFLFKQSQQGAPLATGDYRMEVEVPVGKYRFMAWATAGDDGSYELNDFVAGQTRIEEVKLALKRSSAILEDRRIDDLWYGEILDVDFIGTRDQTETINLIKDTNTVRFIFMGNNNAAIDLDDYTYEITVDNGSLAYDNSVLDDETLSYRPYYSHQESETTVVVEMNTMRFIYQDDARFVVTKKNALPGTLPVLDIPLIELLVLTRENQYAHWDAQQYLDREDSYKIVFIIDGASLEDTWLTLSIWINDWLAFSQDENDPGGWGR